MGTMEYVCGARCLILSYRWYFLWAIAAVLLGFIVGRNCGGGGGGVLDATDGRQAADTMAATTDVSLADATRPSADKWAAFVVKLNDIANNVEELKRLGRRLADGRASSEID